MTTQLRLLLSRLATLVWFLLFALLLLYAWNRQDEPSMPEELAWLMSSLTAPFGFLIAMAADAATTAATRRAGWSYHPFWHLVPMWLAMTSAGYYQWFVALPRFVRNYRESTRARPGSASSKLPVVALGLLFFIAVVAWILLNLHVPF